MKIKGKMHIEGDVSENFASFAGKGHQKEKEFDQLERERDENGEWQVVGLREKAHTPFRGKKKACREKDRPDVRKSCFICFPRGDGAVEGEPAPHGRKVQQIVTLMQTTYVGAQDGFDWYRVPLGGRFPDTHAVLRKLTAWGFPNHGPYWGVGRVVESGGSGDAKTAQKKSQTLHKERVKTVERMGFARELCVKMFGTATPDYSGVRRQCAEFVTDSLPPDWDMTGCPSDLWFTLLKRWPDLERAWYLVNNLHGFDSPQRKLLDNWIKSQAREVIVRFQPNPDWHGPCVGQHPNAPLVLHVKPEDREHIIVVMEGKGYIHVELAPVRKQGKWHGANPERYTASGASWDNGINRFA